MKSLPISFVNECLSYDERSGRLTWKSRPRNHFKSARGWQLFQTKFAGRAAGTVAATTGYIVVNFGKGNLFAGHRLAWVIHHGEWPNQHLDHIDGVRSNNAISNLRECARSQNQANRGAQRNNGSGLKGAHRHTDGVWRSRIKLGKRYLDLGLFTSPEAAHAAYVAAAPKLHGEFARAR